MQRLLGPTLGRFQSEFLNPLIERVFGIMFRANAFLPAPQIISGQNIDVEFIGPLARSQRMEEATAVERLYELAMQLAQADPAVLDIINSDVAIRMRAELLGVPKTVLRGPDEVAQIRQTREQIAAQQMQAEQAQQMANAMQSNARAAKDLGDPQAQKTVQGMEEALPEELL
jgi:hypothetical protein